MSYNVVPFEQTSVPIGEHLVTHTKNDSVEAASQGRQEPWPTKGEVSTALIADNGFVREGLTSFLKGTRFQIVTTAATLSEMDAVMDEQSAPALIIVVSNDATSADALRALRTAYPDAKLVVLGCSDAPGSLLKEACLTAQAVLDHDISSETLIKALDVVMSGATVQSAGLLSRLMAAPSPAEQGASTKEQCVGALLPRPLSSRELDVLRGLAVGDSNKLIAIKHDLAEATVKIHVKNVLRKLQTQNRTQAAIWARENGIYG